MEPKFTPTQRRILDLLADGQLHSKEQIATCLWDELGEKNNIQMHISNIRKIIRPMGQDILCQQEVGYRLVRLMASPYKE